MNITFAPLTAQDAQAVAAWHYPEPYAFYDWDADPDDLVELLTPQHWGEWYHAAHDDVGRLIGVVKLVDERDAVVIGLGLRPDLTGQGLGLTFLLQTMDFARQRFASQAFRLAVAAFNQRAIRVYERAGFRIARSFQQQTNGGVYAFLEMLREA